MHRFFKNYIYIYFTICLIGVAAVWILFGLLFNISVGELAAIIGAIIIALIMCLLFITKMRKINNIMINDCNIEEYIRISNSILSNQTFKKLRTILKLNLSVGYLNDGNSELAKKMLNSIDRFSNTRWGALYRVSYYNSLVAYYFQIKDIGNVIDSMKELQIALKNKKLNNAYKNKILCLYRDKESLLNMENNNYDGAEQVFIAALEREKKMLGKVYAKYTLGIVYLHYNRLEEATEAFEFAAKNGGTSYYVERAKKNLLKLEKIC